MGQSDADFRRAVASHPIETRDIAHEMFWARGPLSKDLKRRIYSALIDLAIIKEVSRDPEGVLALRADGAPTRQEPRSGHPGMNPDRTVP